MLTWKQNSNARRNLFCCCLSVVGNRHGMVLPALQGDVLEEACSNTTNPTIHQWWAQTTPPVSIPPFLLGAERTLAGYPQIKLILGNALSQVTGSQAHVHESKKNSLVYLFLMCDPAQQGPDGILNTKRAFTEQLSLSNLNLLPLNSQSHKFLLKGANLIKFSPRRSEWHRKTCPAMNLSSSEHTVLFLLWKCLCCKYYLTDLEQSLMESNSKGWRREKEKGNHRERQWQSYYRWWRTQ